MVISNIKLGFARKKVAALLRKRGISAEHDEVRSMALLLDTNDDHILNEFKKLQRFLSVKEKDMKVILVSSEVEDKDFNGLIVGPSEITWSGSFRSNEVIEFVNREFDLLVSFARSENMLLNILAEASAACLKIGRKQEESEIFDLSIATNFDEPEVFIAEIQKYLKILNKIKE